MDLFFFLHAVYVNLLSIITALFTFDQHIRIDVHRRLVLFNGIKYLDEAWDALNLACEARKMKRFKGHLGGGFTKRLTCQGTNRCLWFYPAWVLVGI